MKLKQILLNALPDVLVNIVIGYHKYPTKLKINSSIKFNFDYNYLGCINHLIFFKTKITCILKCYNSLTNEYNNVSHKLMEINVNERIDGIHFFKNYIYVQTFKFGIHKLDKTYNIIESIKIRYNDYDYVFFSEKYIIWCEYWGIKGMFDIQLKKKFKKFAFYDYWSSIQNAQIYKNTFFVSYYRHGSKTHNLVLYSLKKKQIKKEIVEFIDHICFQIINNFLFVIKIENNKYNMISYDLRRSKKYEHNIILESYPEHIIKVDFQLFILCQNRIYKLDMF